MGQLRSAGASTSFTPWKDDEQLCSVTRRGPAGLGLDRGVHGLGVLAELIHCRFVTAACFPEQLRHIDRL